MIPRLDELNYSHANESLEAINRAMSFEAGDRVLAVGGSGEQAFSMLEHGCKVVVIDNTPPQIDLIKYRKNCLASGNISTFLHPFSTGELDGVFIGTKKIYSEKECVSNNEAYFKSNDRLEKIKYHLGNLSLLPPMNIFYFLEENAKDFNKIYFSNIVGYLEGDSIKDMTRLSNILSRGTFAYLTSHGQRFGREDSSNFGDFRMDEKRTNTARFFEKFWMPAVYIKN